MRRRARAARRHAGHAQRARSRRGPGGQGVRPDLPQIPAYAAELNQVWTNLIDNALGAMGERRHADRPHRRGTATGLAVEIGDTGAGHPAGDPAAHLRAVLHHQAGRRGHRPRAWTSRTGSWSTSTTATSGWSPSRGGPPSGSCCRSARAHRTRRPTRRPPRDIGRSRAVVSGSVGDPAPRRARGVDGPPAHRRRGRRSAGRPSGRHAAGAGGSRLVAPRAGVRPHQLLGGGPPAARLVRRRSGWPGPPAARHRRLHRVEHRRRRHDHVRPARHDQRAARAVRRRSHPGPGPRGPAGAVVAAAAVSARGGLAIAAGGPRPG